MMGSVKMEIKLEKATIEQKSILRNLLELYTYDFTEFNLSDINEQGIYGYKYLDHYWTEDNRYPFLVRVNGNLAGFALVRGIGQNSSGLETYSIAEFFIMKKYRKLGVGKKVAFEVFDNFHGQWEVEQIEKNVPAQLFWRKTIAEYTGGKFDEIKEVGENNVIQKFSNL